MTGSARVLLCIQAMPPAPQHPGDGGHAGGRLLVTQPVLHRDGVTRVGRGGRDGVVCTVIFVSNPTTVVEVVLCCCWGCNNIIGVVAVSVWCMHIQFYINSNLGNARLWLSLGFDNFIICRKFSQLVSLEICVLLL